MFADILHSTTLHSNYNAAVADVSIPSNNKPPLKLILSFLFHGTSSNILPLFFRLLFLFLTLNILSAAKSSYSTYSASSTDEILSLTKIAIDSLTQSLSHSTFLLFRFARDHYIVDLALFFALLVSLIFFRIFQRLYLWSTFEYKNAPNVKDHPSYQDPVLLDEAWSRAENVGWKPPTDQGNEIEEKNLIFFQKNHGLVNVTKDGSVVFQPRSGWCGVASITSALRSFPLCTTNEKRPPLPYLKMHKQGRYLELLQAKEMLQKLVFNKSVLVADESNDAAPTRGSPATTEWENMGGGQIESMEVVGGGKNGFPSYESFLHALRQINHPTQPARILAIYGRSPMFFCHDNLLSTKIKTFMMGHWSPIPAYLEEQNLVLVMDVNRDYGPRGYLVPPRRLFEAVNTRCCMNGDYRGLILLRPPPPHLPDADVANVAGSTLPPPSPPPSLLYDTTNISLAMGNLKREYYQHVARGGGSGSESSVIRWCHDDSCSISSVVSSHPVTFTNAAFVSNLNTLTVDDLKQHRRIFEDAVVPMRMTVRGCRSAAHFEQIKKMCETAGLVLFMNKTTTWIYRPTPLSCSATVPLKVPDGYYLEEIVTGDVDTIKQWGNIVVTSYGMPNSILRHGIRSSEHFGKVYEQVVHGKVEKGEACRGCLHQFVLRAKESSAVVASSTIFVNESGTTAGVFNICCMKEHRRKGIGKLMSNVVVRKATEMGCQQILLEASPKGEPVYKKLGFVKHVEEHGGVFLSLSIATKSCPWRTLWLLIEFVLFYKSYLLKLAVVMLVVVVSWFTYS